MWQSAEGDAIPSGQRVWGVDLGTTAAQSAIACYWPESGRLEALACFPAEPALADRGLRDGVGRLYVNLAARGELMVAGEYVSDVHALLREALDRWGAPSAVVADRWREGELREALGAASIPPAALSLRGMGFKDGGEDVRLFRSAVLDSKVTPVASLPLRSAMAEARTMVDPAGNAKLSKGSQGGRHLRARDDAAAAAILAVAEGNRGGRTTESPLYAIAG